MAAPRRKLPSSCLLYTSVIVVAALALFFPGTFSVVKTAWVNTLLGIVMFGMGLTLKPEDFKAVSYTHLDVYKRQAH